MTLQFRGQFSAINVTKRNESKIKLQIFCRELKLRDQKKEEMMLISSNDQLFYYNR